MKAINKNMSYISVAHGNICKRVKTNDILLVCSKQEIQIKSNKAVDEKPGIETNVFATVYLIRRFVKRKVYRALFIF